MKNFSEYTGNVLITGGSGLIGRYLTSMLLSEGFRVIHLSRSSSGFGKVRVYRWDPEKHIVDQAFPGDIDFIINLAGENIGKGRWTEKRKKVITGSRIDSVKFLHELVSERKMNLQAFVSASAIGYYGYAGNEREFTESDPAGNDFLGNVCRQWEASADMFRHLGVRTVKIRSGVVLEKTGELIDRLTSPAKFRIFPVPGNGLQYLPWIHIEDICGIYIKALKDIALDGTYNAVSPGQVSYIEFSEILADVMKKSIFRMPVPGFVLKALLGEKAGMILNGNRISSEKIIKTGFSFRYSTLREALENILTAG